MSTTEVKPEKQGVQISKATGGAYIDIREVIESELERIRDGAKEDIRSCNVGHAEQDDQSDKRRTK